MSFWDNILYKDYNLYIRIKHYLKKYVFVVYDKKEKFKYK